MHLRNNMSPHQNHLGSQDQALWKRLTQGVCNQNRDTVLCIEKNLMLHARIKSRHKSKTVWSWWFKHCVISSFLSQGLSLALYKQVYIYTFKCTKRAENYPFTFDNNPQVSVYSFLKKKKCILSAWMDEQDNGGWVELLETNNFFLGLN